VFLKIPAFWNDFIAGAVLLLVLLLDGRVRMAVDRAIRAKRYAVHHHSQPNQPDQSNTPKRDGASASRPQEAGE
jgi:AI-2 transport system permease protein